MKDFKIVNGELIEYVGNEKEVTIPSCVKVIKSGAFLRLDGLGVLKSVIIPKSVEKIEIDAFCDSIEKFEILGTPQVEDWSDLEYRRKRIIIHDFDCFKYSYPIDGTIVAQCKVKRNSQILKNRISCDFDLRRNSVKALPPHMRMKAFFYYVENKNNGVQYEKRVEVNNLSFAKHNETRLTYLALKGKREDVIVYLITNKILSKQNAMMLDVNSEDFSMQTKVELLTYLNDLYLQQGNDVFDCDWDEKQSFSYTKTKNGIRIDEIKKSVESVVIPERIEGIDVNRIGIGCFAYDSKISSITIPRSVKIIEEDAFVGTKIKKIYYGSTPNDWVSIKFKNDSANPLARKTEILFEGESVKNATINTKIIQSFALTLDLFDSITIGADVKRIGYWFIIKGGYVPRYATTIRYQGTPEQWAKITRNNTSGSLWQGMDFYVQGAPLTEVSYYEWMGAAFSTCTSLKRVKLKNVKKICSDAFRWCDNLCEINLEGVSQIGNMAFCGCDLSQLVSDRVLEKIEDFAFSKSNIKKVELKDFGNGGVELGHSVFSDCRRLESAIIECKSLGEGTFSDCSSLKYASIRNVDHLPYMTFLRCEELVRADLDERIKSIGIIAFKNAKKLESINLYGVTDIEYGAFMGCEGLRVVNGTNFVNIGERAFIGCENLETILLSSKTETIGAQAFKDCKSLRDIYIGKNVKNIGEDAFKNCSNLTIYCYADHDLDGYQKGWSANAKVVYGYKKAV